MGSRAIAVVCRDEARARAVRHARRIRSDLHAHRPPVPRRRRARAGAAARRDRRRGAVGGPGERLARARRRDPAVVGEGDGADPAPVRARRRGGAAPRSGRGRRPRSSAAAARGLDVGASCSRAARRRAAHVERYIDAYSRYVWPVDGVDDLRFAPFHVLAAESGAFADRDHAWHLERCDALVAADPDWIRRTDRRFVDLTDPASARPRPPPGGRRSPPPAARAWSSSRSPSPRPAAAACSSRASSAAARSTCGSSTAPSTPPGQLDRLR